MYVTKKGEMDLFDGYYGRFLTRRASSAPTTAIAAIMPTAEYITYVSVLLGGIGSGPAGSRGAGSTTNDVSADDGQYDSEPANVAITVYAPSMSGVHGKVNIPEESL